MAKNIDRGLIDFALIRLLMAHAFLEGGDAETALEKLTEARELLLGRSTGDWAATDALTQRVAELEGEVERLKRLINTPETEDWLKGVQIEAAHQIERWGHADRAGKTPPDWFWLLGYLAGKALAAALSGDVGKLRHHIISSGAVLLNWHRYSTGENTAFRPGAPNAQQLAGEAS
jgi:hypothetical protein